MSPPANAELQSVVEEERQIAKDLAMAILDDVNAGLDVIEARLDELESRG